MYCNCGNRAAHQSIDNDGVVRDICEECRQQCDYSVCGACGYWFNDTEHECPKAGTR